MPLNAERSTHQADIRIAFGLCALLACPAFAFSPCRKEPKGFDKVALEPVVGGLDKPTTIAAPGDGSGRLYVVEQAGVIRVVENGDLAKEPFLDIRSKVRSGGEMGLLGLAFHPKYQENGRFFVNYTTKGPLRTVVAEYGPDKSERRLLVFDQPYQNHNGGALAFGPDGLLYVGVGDGGSGNDPHNNGQNPTALLGKILTLDVEAEKPAAKIFALGMRNPWRLSFDPVTGKLWAGDVGQDDWEEIDVVEAGKNYGWRIMEGSHCTPKYGKDCDKKGLTLPVLDYGHEEGGSVTGGHVYRGRALPGLCGAYVFGDFVSGRMWAARVEDGKVHRALLKPTGLGISTFGVGDDGELYLADYGGGRILKLVPEKK